MLPEPHPTQADLHFRLGSIPVRVHPFFWVAAVLLGLRPDNRPVELLLWVAVVFVSILVHELGHVLTGMRYGQRGHIVLWALGGLAVGSRTGRTGPDLLVLFNGPGFGFVFAGVILVVVALAYGPLQVSFFLENDHIRPPAVTVFYTSLVSVWCTPPENENVGFLLRQLLYVNVFWGLLNLLPVFPLDGGQITYELLRRKQPYEAWSTTLRVSVFTAAALAVIAFFLWQEWYLGIMFALLGINSYFMLVNSGGGFGGGGFGGGGFGGGWR